MTICLFLRQSLVSFKRWPTLLIQFGLAIVIEGAELWLFGEEIISQTQVGPRRYLRKLIDPGCKGERFDAMRQGD
jgi:hypothetical protein